MRTLFLKTLNIMTLIVQQKHFPIFSLSLVLLFVLILTSCENTQQTTDAEENTTSEQEVSSKTTFLADTIPAGVAQMMIDRFHNTPLPDLSSNFYFANRTNIAFKVFSFELDAAQRTIFAQELQEAISAGNDTVEIRIHMAFQDASNANAVSGKTGIAPLLELVLDPNQVNTFFPLRSFASTFLPVFNDLYAWQDQSSTGCPPELESGQKDIRISAHCARDLIINWDVVPSADIAKNLYVNQHISDPNDRIRYYTFDAADTRDINDYIAGLSNLGKPYFFYLHFGLLETDDFVPLRMILHLDDNDIHVSQSIDRASDGAAYFEFSKPCPPYGCKDQ